MVSRSCDMHVHSKHSMASGSWLLRRFRVPESFTPPELVYELARKRGMDYVTITDINSIEGALRIGHLPGTFLSEQVRTYLPGRRSAVHILVYDLTPEQHEEMAGVRESYPALMEYLRDRGLMHSFAHPFYYPEADLSLGDFAMVARDAELVESMNGTRAREENDSVPPVVRAIRGDGSFSGFTGGSDDHCGRFIGLTFTKVEGAGSLSEFLDGVRQGRGRPAGQHGTAVRTAYSLYSVAYSFYRDRLTARQVPTFAKFAADRFFAPGAGREEPTLWHKADFVFHQLLKKARRADRSDFEAVVADNLVEIGRDLALQTEDPGAESDRIDERTYEILNMLTNRLLRHFSSVLIGRVSEGRFLEALESVTALLPVLLLNAPYPVCYLNRRKGRDAVRTVSREYAPEVASGLRDSNRRVWFTDTIDDLNGVSRTIQRYSRIALSDGRELAIAACQSRPLSFPGWVVNFPPLQEFPIPGYTTKLLSIPPFLELLRFVEDERFGMMYISTPGPVGVAALGIARLLDIPCAGIYHTDYPRHVNRIVEDGRLGELAGVFASWFYNAVDMVLVPSRFYMDDLEAMGVERSRMELFPRGTDCELFSPAHRSDTFLGRFGGTVGSTRLVYVGRISREKDLDVLADAFLEARKELPYLELYFVGDGPYLGELVNRLSGRGGYFCGEMHGRDLSAAYASGDIFVFPSSTDTYGNSVLEAQASGLPAIVSDAGGPQEIIEPGRTGLVFRSHDTSSLLSAIVKLAEERETRERMAESSRELAASRTWEDAFDRLWDISPSQVEACSRSGRGPSRGA